MFRGSHAARAGSTAAGGPPGAPSQPPHAPRAAHTQIRNLINACLAKIYATADTLPMFSRISELQAYLASKDGMGKPTADVGAAAAGRLA